MGNSPYRIDPIWYFTDKLGVRFGVFGIAAVYQITCHYLLLTASLPTGDAIATRTTGVAHPRYGHPITFLDFLYTIANTFDDSYRFVPRN